MEQTEICIVGAGPAGASAALKLSHLGIGSTLLDKAVFPRDKVCGDALSGKITLQLSRLSNEILERFRARAENTDVWGVRFTPPNGLNLEFPFKIDYDKNEDEVPGYTSKRIDFDNFLIEEVKRRTDIDFREQVEIIDYQKVENGWELKSKDGSTHIQCKMLLLADGAHSRFSRHIAGHKKEDAHHAAAVRAYYEGVTAFHDDNFIELHFLKELAPGYFWVFPLPNGGANVGLGMRSDLVKKRRLNLTKIMEDIVENHPKFKDRFKNAERKTKILGYGLPLGSKKRSISGDNYMLLGDAGHLIDPLTGEGIGNAFYSGFIAAELIEKCIKDNRYDAAYLKAYDVRVDRVLCSEMRLSYKLQKLMQYTFIVNFLSSFIHKNPKFIEIFIKMYSDFEFRKQLVNPLFWVKALLKR